MNKMFKNQALWIGIALSFLFTVAASATTLVRPQGVATYPAGTKAVGPTVDADFNNIVSFLNNANLDSTNLALLGVTTGIIAGNAVTPAKLSAPNIVITNSSSVFQTISSTPTLITNLTATITLSGLRPVRVWLEPNPGTYQSGGVALPDSGIKTTVGSSGDGVSLYFVKNGATTAFFSLREQGGLGSTAQTAQTCSALSYTDWQPAAGTFTYSAFGSVTNNTADGLRVLNCRLVVEEF